MSNFLIRQLADSIAGRSIGNTFGIPGSGSSLVLIDALEQRGVSFHTVQHEGAAAIMAGTVGRLTGVAGVAVSIKGPGLANMVPGLALCHLESFPLVAISEAYSPGAPRHRAHKRMDQPALVAACTKACILPDESDQVFNRAAGLAETENPGPVLLELPDRPIAGRVQCPADSAPVQAGLPEVLAQCRRPVLIVGSLGIRLGLSESLNRLKIPVFSTAAAKGVVDETLTHAAGVCTGVGLKLTAEAALLPKADCVIAIGLRAREMLGVAAFGVPIVAIDSATDDGAAEWKFGDVLPPSMVSEVLAQLEGLCWGQDEIRCAHEATAGALGNGVFLPAHVLAAIERRFGADVRVVLDTGNFCTVAEHVCLARRPNDVLLSGQARYMGVGLPMAIAAAVQDRTRPVVLVAGDGGIGPWIGELRLAIALGLSLLVVLVSDGGFSSIRGRAVRDGLTLKPLTPVNASWLAVMEGFGLPGAVALDSDAFERVIDAWKPADGPAYVEARFQAQPYDAMIAGVR